MVDTKEQRDALVKKVYADNFTHADDCQDIWRLCEMVDELQARAESAEQERDKLRAALEHAESHIQEMENAEGRAFFADTAAMAKQLGSVTQERDALAERVKALEDFIRDLTGRSWLAGETWIDKREEARKLLENDHA